MKNPSISISVVIPVYNGGDDFRKCLASLTKNCRSPDEIIVVSDGDTDGSWKVAEAFGAKVIKLPASGGPARARNVGAKAARGDILFFVDADVTLHSDTLKSVGRRFERSPDLDALIGSYDDEPGADNFLSQYKNLFHHYTHQVSSEAVSTFWGACGAVRRSVFEAVGGFDESYRKPCIEDIELGYRLTRAGHSILLCKEIQVKHLKRWEPRSLLRAEILYRALPWSDLILRDRSFDANLNLSHANRLSVISVFALTGSLLGTGPVPELWLAVAALTVGLLIINLNIYRFFHSKRGLMFTLQVIPWHWFYFLYGGAAFGYGTLKHSLSHIFHLPDPMTIWGIRHDQ